MAWARRSAAAVLTGGVLVIGSPAVAQAAPNSAAACTPTVTKSAAPAVGASTTVTVGSAGTVEVTRATRTRLRITATIAASGYGVRTVTAAGTTVKVVFRLQGTTSHIRVTAHLGNRDKDRLYVLQSVCA